MKTSLKDSDAPKPRGIPSYVLRHSRMTPSQAEACVSLWSRYGLNPMPHEKIDLNTVFSREAERVCEIGFGMGQSLIQMALAHPHRDYVGIEVHTPGIGALLMAIAAAKINNIRILQGDAAVLLPAHFASHTWDGFQVFFPDPWPKRRHHKRRLLQLPFLTLMQQQLKPDGFLQVATDWEDYAKEILKVLSAMSGFVNAAGIGEFAERPLTRPLTKFENRGLKRGYKVWDLLFYAR